MQKRIALLYDFDYTLTDGFMQSFGLMQDLGYNDIREYFDDNDNIVGGEDMDMCLSMMAGIVCTAKNKDKKVTKEYLKNFGKDIVYYPGVEEWFNKINAIGKSKGYEIEHYVISSGLKEIVEGCSIAKYLKRIYANFFAYDSQGYAYWPSQVVNYSSKVQYIFRVRKNVLDDLGDVSKVNEKMSDNDVLPFKNIIYLGDSQTDIPSFKVVKNSGGMSICVYSPFNPKSKGVAQKCFIEGRVNYFVPADYREGSDLFELVKNYIETVIEQQEKIK
ncbi:MAG: haloacid dehalogenase-like hydrolase [Christensenellales bacterium]